jgi:AcrR family transcriptional regulator
MAKQTGGPKPRRPATDLTTGRVNQKARTYRALIEAAIAFVRVGQDFSVSDVADAARVGRTTAYTYFPTKEALFAQAVTELVVRSDYASLSQLFLEENDVEARVLAVVEASDASLAVHEEQYRAMLRLSLQPDSDGIPPRPGFRKKRLADALAPVRDQLDSCAFQRLVAALTLCIGIEPQINLRDVCALTADEARNVKLWTARALLKAALHDAEIANSAASLDGSVNARRGTCQ